MMMVHTGSFLPRTLEEVHQVIKYANKSSPLGLGKNFSLQCFSKVLQVTNDAEQFANCKVNSFEIILKGKCIFLKKYLGYCSSYNNQEKFRKNKNQLLIYLMVPFCCHIHKRPIILDSAILLRIFLNIFEQIFSKDLVRVVF